MIPHDIPLYSVISHSIALYPIFDFPSGNQMWLAGKNPARRFIAGKIIYKWEMCQQAAIDRRRVHPAIYHSFGWLNHVKSQFLLVQCFSYFGFA